MTFIHAGAELLPAVVADNLYGCMPEHTHVAMALPRARDVLMWEPELLPAFIISCCEHGKRVLYSFN